MTEKIAELGDAIAMDDMRYFVLDTNVLLHNAEAIRNFKQSTIIITMKVLSELDTFKSGNDIINLNSRLVTRFLDKIRSQHPSGALRYGVSRGNGGYLQIINEKSFVTDSELDMSYPDNKIISVAYQLMKNGKKVVFVSKDINARLRADYLGIPVEDYERQKVFSDDLFFGHQTIPICGKLIDDVHISELIVLPAGNFMPNEFVTLVDKGNPKHSVITRAIGENKLVKIDLDNKKIFGITGRNKEQRMALNLLLDPSISLVTLIGQAGTGKTLLAVTAALHLVMDLNMYEKIVFSRAIIPMGKDLGYLPGSKEEKIAPWMEALTDSLAIICREKSNGKYDSSMTPNFFISNNIIEPATLTYVRGRSIPMQLIIVDEVQNLTPHEVKTIVSRAGEGTKVILMGDPHQIDNPYLDERSNGLSYVVDRMKYEKIHGHITISETVRSALAQAAVERL
jgi:PhoH-like ATPase